MHSYTYTLPPMPDENIEDEAVLSTVRYGGPFWARTRDLSLIRTDAYSSQSKKDCDLVEAIVLWESELALGGIASATIDSYRQKVSDLLAYSVTPDELAVKTFLSNKQRAGASTGTIANYVKAFRSFFNYLVENHLYVFDTSRLHQPKVKYQERCVPKDEDVSALMRTLDNDEDRTAFLLLIDCGIRVTELATIKVSDIDFSEASIQIHGKGSKTRIVYMSETSVKQLKHYVGTLKSEQLFAPVRSDAKIAYRGRRYFERRLDELCARAGVARITPHALRHYFATHALSHGADVKAVSEFLGHADVTITLKIYHHVNAKAIRQMHQAYSPIAGLALPVTA
jgi:site-specific recombinase XerD